MANVNLANAILHKVGTPVNPTDGANKAYVDALISTTLSGAGPHTISATLPNRVTFTSPGVAGIANLPALSNASVIDGWRILFVNGSTASDMMILVPNGSDTIGGAAFYRIFQKGLVGLVANKASNTWILEAEHVGFPTVFNVYVDNAGLDTNYGTSTSPVLSIQRALELADVNWTVSATVNLTAGYVDVSTTQYVVPGPKVGSAGAGIIIQGPAMIDAGFGTLTCTGGFASTNSEFRRVTVASNPALANNAGAEYFVKGLTGGITSINLPAVYTTNTTVEFLSINTFVVISTGTFQLRKPNASVLIPVGSSFKSGSGRNLTFNDVYVDGAGGGDVDNLINVTFNRCIFLILTGGMPNFRGNSNISTSIFTSALTGGGGVWFQTAGSLVVNTAQLRGQIRGTNCDVNLNVISIAQQDTINGLNLFFTTCTGSVGGVKTFELAGGSILFSTGCRMTLGGNYQTTAASAPSMTTPPIQIGDRCEMRLQTLTGSIDVTGGVTEAITIQTGSNALVVGPTTTVTLSLSSGPNAIRVGVQGVKTWAQILAGAAADTFDGGSAFGTAVWVTKL